MNAGFVDCSGWDTSMSTNSASEKIVIRYIGSDQVISASYDTSTGVSVKISAKEEKTVSESCDDLVYIEGMECECELDSGHEGLHQRSGEWGGVTYQITWEHNEETEEEEDDECGCDDEDEDDPWDDGDEEDSDDDEEVDLDDDNEAFLYGVKKI